eukprot:1392050-Amorphochlora_amoeboformis.AAC.1
MTIINAHDTRPLGPWVVFRTLVWGQREKFEVSHTQGAMADRRAYAVCACVTTSDHDDMLAFGRDVALGVRGKEVHCEFNALEGAAGDVEVAGDSGAGGEDHGIVDLI